MLALGREVGTFRWTPQVLLGVRAKDAAVGGNEVGHVLELLRSGIGGRPRLDDRARHDADVAFLRQLLIRV